MALGNFIIGDLYTAIITKLNAKFDALATMFRDQSVGDGTNQIRYNSSTKKFQYCTAGGTSNWSDLDLSGIVVGSAAACTGNALTSTNATNHGNDFTGAVHGATDAPTNGMLVRRNSSGNFSANIITATLNGAATSAGTCGTATNATQLNGQPSSYYQPSSSAITTSNIANQSVNYASSAGTAGNVSKAVIDLLNINAGSCSGNANTSTTCTGQAASVAPGGVPVATGTTFGGLKFSRSGTTLYLSSSANV